MSEPQNLEQAAAAHPEPAPKSGFEHVCEPGYPHPCEPLPVCEPADELDDEDQDLTGVAVVETPPVYNFEPPPDLPPEPAPSVRVAELPTFPVSPYATGFYQQQAALAAIGIARKVIGGPTVTDRTAERAKENVSSTSTGTPSRRFRRR